MEQEKRFINEKQYADLRGASVFTVRNERIKRQGLAFYKIGKSVRYRYDEVLAFLERCRVETRDSQ